MRKVSEPDSDITEWRCSLGKGALTLCVWVHQDVWWVAWEGMPARRCPSVEAAERLAEALCFTLFDELEKVTHG